MSKKDTKISPEERQLFRDSMKKGKFLHQDQQTHPTPSPSNEEQPLPPQESQILLGKIYPADWLNAEDYIHFAKNGIPYRTQNKLKRGQIAIEERLDLHQLTGDQALNLSAQFLQDCIQQSKRCVLIIHGKGEKCVLKNLLNYWLRQQPHVLAFTSAKPYDGGRGALYVLLKK